MAKTSAERQAAYRARLKRRGAGRANTIISNDAKSLLAKQSEAAGLAAGEYLERLLATADLQSMLGDPLVKKHPAE